MTHFILLRFRFFVFSLIFVLSQVMICNSNVNNQRENTKFVPLNNINNALSYKQERESASSNVVKTEQNKLYAQNHENSLPGSNFTELVSNVTSKKLPGSVTTPLPATPVSKLSNGLHIPSINYGALMRGIFVVIALSIIVMAYMVFRSFMINKTHPQMVRKYGILAHRQDVEMRPLPLNEDDDDDTTVFDATDFSAHRLQPQSS